MREAGAAIRIISYMSLLFPQSRRRHSTRCVTYGKTGAISGICPICSKNSDLILPADTLGLKTFFHLHRLSAGRRDDSPPPDKKREIHGVKAVADLSLLGIILFLMVWEANNRQLYNQLPVIILGAVLNIRLLVSGKIPSFFSILKINP